MTEWRKPSQCGDSQCVEVSAGDGIVWLRASRFSYPLAYTPEEFSAFVVAVKAGEYDSFCIED
jgi:hypothetical protein